MNKIVLEQLEDNAKKIIDFEIGGKVYPLTLVNNSANIVMSFLIRNGNKLPEDIQEILQFITKIADKDELATIIENISTEQIVLVFTEIMNVIGGSTQPSEEEGQTPS